jgi:hypothetical protein
VSSNSLGIRFVCAMAVAVCTATSASAQQQQQQRDPGPYGNLFKGSGQPQSQSLDIRGGLFGGYDDNLLAQAPDSGQTNPFDPRFQVPGITTGVNSTATYGYAHAGRGRSASQFRFGSTASVAEFTGADKKPFWSQNYNAGTAFGTNLTPKILFGANVQASYAPYYQYVPFLTNGTAPSTSIPSAVPADGTATDSGAAPVVPVVATSPAESTFNPSGSDVGFATESRFVGTLTAGASITDRFTKRASISAEGQLTETEVFGQNQARVEGRLARATLSYQLTRKVGVHGGYGLQDVRYIQNELPNTRLQNHLIDFGIDYGDGGSFTFARYYNFSFGTGVSALRNGDSTYFRLEGNASLTRRIGRTWSASTGASRGTAYIVGFTAPIFTDSVNAGVGGQLGPRLNLSTGANYARGRSAFSSSGGTLVSTSASARLTVAISQHLGLYGQYSYYQYDVPDGFFSTVAFTQHQHRRSASVGLTFWLPLINQQTARQQ